MAQYRTLLRMLFGIKEVWERAVFFFRKYTVHKSVLAHFSIPVMEYVIVSDAVRVQLYFQLMSQQTWENRGPPHE
jgi:hypothetical protein